MCNSTDPKYVEWDDAGEVFWVANPGTFSREVLPVYFKHNKYMSFVRNLSSYGADCSYEHVLSSAFSSSPSIRLSISVSVCCLPVGVPV